MPEVTSVEAIRAKLGEFDRYMADALGAVRTLVRIRADAEVHLAEIQKTALRNKEAQVATEELRAKVDGIQSQWDRLRQEVTQAGERLAEEIRITLAAQADLLGGLEASTRASAATADAARATAVEVAGRMKASLTTARGELESEVRTRLSQAEELIESETRRIEKYLEQEHVLLTGSVTRQREEMQRQLAEEISSFKAEMRQGLSDHQRIIDRQLTDFLNKQNALVQNLTQQIDGFHRASQAQAAVHAQLATSVSELGTRVEEARHELTALVERLASVESSQEEVSIRLGETREKLRALPVVGRRFA